MAKNKPPRVEGSILLRSAQSLGRVIGSLQRQIDDVAARLRAGTDKPLRAAARGRNPQGSAKANGAPPSPMTRAKPPAPAKTPAKGKPRSRAAPAGAQKKRRK